VKIESRLLRGFVTLQVAWWMYLGSVVGLSNLIGDFILGAFLAMPVAALFAIPVSVKLRP
jgi:hypothetical protein